MRDEILFSLNGEILSVKADSASMMLADFLRNQKGLTGTKIVCAEGDCGACTVLRYFPNNLENEFVPINSCITTVAQMDGSHLLTIESLEQDGKLHEVQNKFVDAHASQCGFCTPGFVMSAVSLVEEKISKNHLHPITQDQAKNCFTGNLCRCTGYKPIIEAAKTIDLKNCEKLKDRYLNEDIESKLKDARVKPVILKSHDFTFYAPVELSDALEFLEKEVDLSVIAAGTDVGVLHNKHKKYISNVLSLHLVSELYDIKIINNKVSVGARVTLSTFREFIKDHIKELAHYLDIFASPQIKNVATLVGNVANASPIGDTPSALLALDAVVHTRNIGGARDLPLKDFYVSYKKTLLQKNELITSISFDLPAPSTRLCFLKNSNRKDLDISTINFAMKTDWNSSNGKVLSNVTLAMGGIAPIPLRLKKTEDYLKNNIVNSQNADQLFKVFHSEFTPISDVRATSAYRRVISEHLLKSALEKMGIFA